MTFQADVAAVAKTDLLVQLTEHCGFIDCQQSRGLALVCDIN